MTTQGGGATQGGGGRRYAPSQAELRDPVRRARAARRLRDGGPPVRDRVGRGVGVIVGLVLVVAVFVVVGGVLFMTVLRPAIGGWVTGVAYDNPSLLGIGWVSDLVRDDLGPALTDPAGSSTADVTFTVEPGDTAGTIAERLAAQDLIRDPRAFVFLANERDIGTRFLAGQHLVRQTMTPDEIATALLVSPPAEPRVTLSIRTGLRLEQIAALIEAKPADANIAELTMSAADFVDYVRNPPTSLLADYPWVVVPKGGSLEGYLAAGDYELAPDATPEALVRKMLDRFLSEVGPGRMQVPESRGLSWYQVLTMASIVEQEAKFDSEKAKIAGVLQNRLVKKTAETAGFLGSDPTVFYVNDTLKLAKLPVAKWVDYLFWAPFEGELPAKLPAGVAKYNTYTSKGLPPGPIDTPTVASIDAALKPDTKGGYLYFLAKKDGTTVFAKTYAEHQKNIDAYMK